MASCTISFSMLIVEIPNFIWLNLTANLCRIKKANVANQREHLILLLANMDIRNKSVDDDAHYNEVTVSAHLIITPVWSNMHIDLYLFCLLSRETVWDFSLEIEYKRTFLQLDRYTVQQLKDKIFKNYESWCKYLHCPSNLRWAKYWSWNYKHILLEYVKYVKLF